MLVDRRGRNAAPVLAVHAVNTVTTIFTVRTVNAVPAIFAVHAVNAVTTIFAVHAVNAVPAVLACFTGVALFALRTVRALDRAKVQLRAAAQQDLQLSGIIDRDILDSDAVRAVRSVFTVYAILAVRTILAVPTGFTALALFSLCADNDAQIGYIAVGIGQHELALLIDLGLYDTDTVFSVRAVQAVCTVCSVFPVSADDPTKVRPLLIGESKHKLPVRVDLRFDHADPIGSVLAVQTVLAVLAVFPIFAVFAVCAILAVFSVCADDPAEVGCGPVRIGQLQFARGIDESVGNADAILAVLAIQTIFTVLTDHNAQIRRLTVGISQNQFTADDLGFYNANAIFTVFADDLIQIHDPAIRKAEQELPLGIDGCAADADAVLAIQAILAVLSVFPVLAVLSVCTVLAVFADGNARIQDGSVRQGDEQLALSGKGSRADRDHFVLCRRVQRIGPVRLRPGVAVFLCDLIGRLAVQGFQPFLQAALVTVFFRQFIGRKAVFYRRPTGFMYDLCHNKGDADHQKDCQYDA